MKHQVTISGLSHTIELSEVEACKLMAALAKAVAMAVGPGISSQTTEFDLEINDARTGEPALGRLQFIVRV